MVRTPLGWLDQGEDPDPPTPAEQIKAAASRLDVLLAPLGQHPEAWGRMVDTLGGKVRAYIDTMNPALGHALVVWLRDAARDAEEIGYNPLAHNVARTILGEDQ